MSELYNFLRPLIFRLEPELAHKLAIKFIKCGCLPDMTMHVYEEPFLRQEIFGLEFSSPVGLAAGFDKNAEISSQIHKLGFGFAEVGTVTPRAQAGNPKPRMFRLQEHSALINRLGFNNKGLNQALENIGSQSFQIPVGINIGPNKTSTDFERDYQMMIEGIYQSQMRLSYVTINVSSPNTPGLRDLQQTQSLDRLLTKVCRANADFSILSKRLPIFLKLSPDMELEQLKDSVEIAVAHKIDALIISNTTTERPAFTSHSETGGLSGKPLLDLSTKTLAHASNISRGRIKLVGVGGVFSAEDAYLKFEAGANLVQLYTGLVYEGFGVAKAINSGLVTILTDRGFNHISQIVGTGVERILS